MLGKTIKLELDKLFKDILIEKEKRLGLNSKNRTTFETKKFIIGGASIIIKPPYINLPLEKTYGRKNLTLKIFIYQPYPLEMNIYNCHWGQESRMFESITIQNILAYDGYAPYVADLIFIKHENIKYLTQVVEYVEDKSMQNFQEFFNKIDNYCFQNNILHYDVSESNIIGEKIVDFQGFKFTRTDNKYGSFIAHFMEVIKKGLSFGGDTVIPYQSIEELGIEGRRNNLERQKFIDIKKYESAIDIGCNGAYFLRRMADYGATRLVGVDLPSVNKAAHWLNNYLGYFSIQFQEEIPDDKFDIVFFLSGLSYFPDLERICNLTRKVMFFEGHGGHRAEEYLTLLTPYFKTLEVKGYVNDTPESGERVIIKCQKSQ